MGPLVLNAFDLIILSQGLNLSAIFDRRPVRNYESTSSSLLESTYIISRLLVQDLVFPYISGSSCLLIQVLQLSLFIVVGSALEYYFDDVVRNALCTEIIHNILPFLTRIQWSTKPVLFHRSLQMLFYRVWKLLHNQWASRHTFVTIR